MRRIIGYWPEVALALALGLITLAAAKGWTAGLDEGVRAFVKAHQYSFLEAIAVVLNKLGQGVVVAWILAGGLTLYLLWRTRDWRNALPWAVAFALTYLTIGPLKIWSHRDSPNSVLPNAVEFFNEQATYTMSYPSGHVVNAIVWWGVIARAQKLVPARPLQVIPPIIVVCTTTYLGHHWLTDGLAAVALGLLIDRIMARAFPETLRPLRRASPKPVRRVSP
ncbi:phosphatase PAP2 family protein [Allorhizocola rhizosphaerae]|uniref:phosphatase PAP2 family protein n=1 Tax=Allorhizocola rhizosphaerae TaxID=1872709 RepID=UPI000E3DCFCF|nr:phosphatase PAP2 family protein [Allorhizocola rhizosphaerae]